MGRGFKHGPGGGTSLNFKVVGNPQPENPAENTIWANTDVEITDWVLSANAPESPVQGLLWIKTGASSPAPFNALKKNNITICPLSAQQYVDGAWVSVTCQSRQSGAWVEWIPYLYNRGDECTDFGGNWVCRAWKMSSDAGSTAQTFDIARNADNLKFTKTGLIGAVMHKENKIDLTDIDTICFKGEMYPGSTARWAGFYVWSEMDGVWDTNAVAKVLGTSNTTTTEFELDVSALEGEYYIGFGIYQEVCYVKLEELFMEEAS